MNILMPLPAHDFDPTEVCVTWQILTDAGHGVVFATPDGQRAHADPLMVTGEGLDVWGWVPGLKKVKLLGLMLRAQSPARQAYTRLEHDVAFLRPLTYAQADAQARAGGFDALLLPARSISPVTGRSVLYGRKTTALTWALERSAWNLTRWWARFWDPMYYRTYFESGDEPAGYWSVEAEVKRSLADEADFCDAPPQAKYHWRKTLGVLRDSAHDPRPAWVVQDGPYVSARWPGDVYTFASTFAALLRLSTSGQVGEA